MNDKKIYANNDHKEDYSKRPKHDEFYLNVSKVSISLLEVLRSIIQSRTVYLIYSHMFLSAQENSSRKNSLYSFLVGTEYFTLEGSDAIGYRVNMTYLGKIIYLYLSIYIYILVYIEQFNFNKIKN